MANRNVYTVTDLLMRALSETQPSERSDFDKADDAAQARSEIAAHLRAMDDEGFADLPTLAAELAIFAANLIRRHRA